MMVPKTVAGRERVGRRVSSESNARKAKRGNYSYRDFLPKTGERIMSVDRLDFPSISDMTKIVRSYSHPFYGWLTKTAGDVRDLNCEVKSDPKPENPYHALISLPAEVAADRDRQKYKARELAEVCGWNEPVDN